MKNGNIWEDHFGKTSASDFSTYFPPVFGKCGSRFSTRPGFFGAKTPCLEPHQVRSMVSWYHGDKVIGSSWICFSGEVSVNGKSHVSSEKSSGNTR